MATEHGNDACGGADPNLVESLRNLPDHVLDELRTFPADLIQRLSSVSEAALCSLSRLPVDTLRGFSSLSVENLDWLGRLTAKLSDGLTSSALKQFLQLVSESSHGLDQLKSVSPDVLAVLTSLPDDVVSDLMTLPPQLLSQLPAALSAGAETIDEIPTQGDSSGDSSLVAQTLDQLPARAAKTLINLPAESLKTLAQVDPDVLRAVSQLPGPLLNSISAIPRDALTTVLELSSESAQTISEIDPQLLSRLEAGSTSHPDEDVNAVPHTVYLGLGRIDDSSGRVLGRLIDEARTMRDVGANVVDDEGDTDAGEDASASSDADDSYDETIQSDEGWSAEGLSVFEDGGDASEDDSVILESADYSRAIDPEGDSSEDGGDQTVEIPESVNDESFQTMLSDDPSQDPGRRDPRETVPDDPNATAPGGADRLGQTIRSADDWSVENNQDDDASFGETVQSDEFAPAGTISDAGDDDSFGETVQSDEGWSSEGLSALDQPSDNDDSNLATVQGDFDSNDDSFSQTVQSDDFSGDGGGGESYAATVQTDDFTDHGDESFAQTLASADLSPEDQRTMADAWGDGVDQGDNPGMTIKSDSLKSVSPKQTLIITPRQLSTRNIDDYNKGGRRPPEPDDPEYELVKKLGEGGMGVVYTARQRSIDREVALKMLKSKTAKDAEQRAKFLSEAVVTGELDHPNIVPIYDVGATPDNALFYAMKKVEGTPWLDDLKDAYKSLNTPEPNLTDPAEIEEHRRRKHAEYLSRQLDILTRVGDAVAFAHDRGVIHRDLKPENVMLGAFNEVLVMDWGLAYSTADFRKSESITESTSMGGTPAYMAPEMATGPISKIGPPSDIFLMGAMLFEIVTGKPPHAGRNAMKCLMAAARNQIREVDSEKVGELDPTGELLEIAHKAMETKPEDRYQSIAQMQAAVRDYKSHTESVLLTMRAVEELEEAKDKQDYDTFSRARFGYEEAIALWSKNRGARDGLMLVRYEYAKCAQTKGDFDLGMSLLDVKDSTHKSLYDELDEAKQTVLARERQLEEQKRRGAKLRRIIMVGSMAAMILMSGLAGWAWIERGVAQEQRVIAEKSEEEALFQKGVAVENEKKAIENETKAIAAGEKEKIQRVLAQAAEKKAKEEEAKAIAAREDEKKQRLLAVAAKQKAEEEERKAIAAKEEETKQRVLAVAAKKRAEAEEEKAIAAKEEETKQRLLAVVAEKKAKDEEKKAIAAGEQEKKQRLLAQAAEKKAKEEEKKAIAAGEQEKKQRLLAQAAEKKAKEEEKKAIAAKEQEKKQRLLAVAAEKKAKEEEQKAKAEEKKAIAAKEEETKQRLLAEKAQKEEALARLAEEEQAYIARIGLADARIRENGFDTARSILAACPKRLRGWEWRRLMHLCEQSDDPFDNGEPVEALALSPDGTKFVTGGWGGEAIIWDIDTGKRIVRLPHQGQYVYSVAWSANGKLIATGSDDAENGFIQLWLAETGKRIERQFGADGDATKSHTDAVLSVEFSANGSQLLTSSYDTSARLWNVADGSQIRRFFGHTGWVWDASFSPETAARPNRNKIVTASQDGRSIVWDVETGEPGAPFTGHDGAVYTARFSPDGVYVATGGYDKRVLLWKPSDVRDYDFERLAAENGIVAPESRFIAMDGHAGPVRNLRFSADGNRLISGSADNTVRLWSTEGGQLVKAFRGHDGAVRAIQFLAQDQMILSASHDHRIRKWNISEYEEIRVLASQVIEGHLDAILSAGFSPDGTRIVTASRDRTARTWDGTTGAELQVFEEGHSFLVSSAVFFPSGRRLATSAVDNSVRVWDVDSGTQIYSLKGTGRAAALAVSADGRWLITGSDKNTARIFDARNGDLKFELTGHKNEVTAVAISQDNRLVLTGDSRGRVILWDLPNEKIVHRLNGHGQKRINAAAFLRDSNRALTACSDNSVAQWNISTGKEELSLTLKHPDSVVGMAVRPGTNQVLTACGDGSVRLWDADKAEVVGTLKSDATATDVDIDPMGEWALAVGSDAKTRIWPLKDAAGIMEVQQTVRSNDRLWSAIFAPSGNGLSLLTLGGSDARLVAAEDGETLMTFSPHGIVASANYSPDGKRIVTGSWDYSARIWKADESGKPEDLLKLTGENGHTGIVNSAVFSPDPEGARVLTASSDGTAKLWNSQTGEVLRTLAGHEGAVRHAVFSPDGTLVLTSSDDGTARVWNSETGEQAGEPLTGHEQAVLFSRFSEDGAQIVSASEDRTARVWDANTREELYVLEGHTARVTCVAFAPGGKRVVTASQDGTVKVWDSSRREEILTLDGHTREVTSVAFSPDGRYILTASQDGTAILWLTWDEEEEKAVAAVEATAVEATTAEK